MAIDPKKIWDEVQENLKLLNGCPAPHDFVRVDFSKAFMSRWRCQKCQGTVDNASRIWYERGREHERKLRQ